MLEPDSRPPAADRPADRARMFTRAFLFLLTGGFLFAASGMTVRAVPLFVSEELSGNALAVGVVVGLTAVSAIAIRPWLARRANVGGRQRLILAGLVSGALYIALSGVASNLAVLGGYFFVASCLATGTGTGTGIGIGTGLGVPDLVTRARPGDTAHRHVHPAAILPGSIMALGLVGPVAFTSFIALHQPETAERAMRLE
jgi:MFS family permease